MLIWTAAQFLHRNTKIVIYGEEDKYVPMSRNRVSDIVLTTDDVILTLQGTSGESTIISNFIDGEITRHACTFGQSGIATLSLRDVHSSCVANWWLRMNKLINAMTMIIIVFCLPPSDGCSPLLLSGMCGRLSRAESNKCVCRNFRSRAKLNNYDPRWKFLNARSLILCWFYRVTFWTL